MYSTHCGPPSDQQGHDLTAYCEATVGLLVKTVFEVFVAFLDSCEVLIQI